MKKLLLLLVIAVAAMLPQGTWAGAVVDGTTLTITTTAPGQVSGFVSNLSNKSSITKIVLNGYFNTSDLEAIQNSAGFTAVNNVDMGEAQFVNSSGGSTAPSSGYYRLFTTEEARTAASATNGDLAIVGGTLYQSFANAEWRNVSTPNEGTDVVTLTSTETTSGYSIGTYGKLNPGTTWYVQMSITNQRWSSPYSIPTVSDAIDLTNGGQNEITDVSGYLSTYSVGQTVYVYWYYYSVQENGSWRWTRGTKSDYDAGTTKYDNPTDADITNLSHNFAGNGNVFRVKVYYTKTGDRNWTNDTQTEPTGVQQITDMSGYEYAYRDNHKDGYADGEWVKLTAWTYYQLQGTNTWRWEKVSSYSEGQGFYIDKKYPTESDRTSDNSMPTREGQYAIVMGTTSGETFTAATEYYYDNTGWHTPGTTTFAPNYAQMKFSYWSSTLVTAKTSRFADETISNEIFQNCTHLTHVDYMGGNVTGFGDHTSQNYANFTITFGKDVTKIDNAAFRRCTALTAINGWGEYTDADRNSRIYPKRLRIENEAFMQARNLMTVNIPNRVSYIGDNAFKEVGNGSITDINNSNNDTNAQNHTFTLTFERRNAADQSNVAINCDFELNFGSSAFMDCWYLKELSLPIRLESMGDDCFKNSIRLDSLQIRETTESAYTPPTGHDVLRTIPNGAFSGSSVAHFIVPKSVTRIETNAFGSTFDLKTVTIQDTDEKDANGKVIPLYIETGAFAFGDEQKRPAVDVYVDIDPAHRMVYCEYDAFTYTSMVGQTSVSSRQFGKLHFSKEYWDYYQGNWKRGLAFRQDNLNAFKDGYTGEWGGREDPNNQFPNCGGMANKYSDYIYEATGKYHKDGVLDSLVAPANGWQQFTMTTTDIDIDIPRGSFMRTFSTNDAYVIPTFAETSTGNGIEVHAGDPMFEIYRVVSFSDGYQNGQDVNNVNLAQQAERVATAKRVNMGDLNGRGYIPSETGLIMVGKIPADYVVYFADAEFGTKNQVTVNERKYPFNVCTYSASSATDSLTNLLYPSCIDDMRMNGVWTNGVSGHTDPMTGEPTIVKANGSPLNANEVYNDITKVRLHSTIPYPYYGDNVYFRLFGYYKSSNSFKRVNTTITRDKAYLKLSKNMFHWAYEFNENDNGSSSGVNDPTSAATSRVVSLVFSEDDESQTTGIQQIDQTLRQIDNDSYYTLQGAKLNGRPTQRGIYIHNGKKVIVK